MHLYSHAGMGSWQEVVGPIDKVLQDAVGQVLLVQLVGHCQAGLRHHPACQQGQRLRLQGLCHHTYTHLQYCDVIYSKAVQANIMGACASIYT